MKFLITLIPLFLLSCSDEPLNPFYNTSANPFNGHWEIHISGDLPGAATIYVNSVGTINNGIPVLYYVIAKVTTYIDGSVSKEGILESRYYTNYTFIDSIDTIDINIVDGFLYGSFSADSANGNYSVNLFKW